MLVSKYDLLLMQYHNNLCRKRYQSVEISYWTSAPPMPSSLTLPSLQNRKTTNSLKYNWYTDENIFFTKQLNKCVSTPSLSGFFQIQITLCSSLWNPC